MLQLSDMTERILYSPLSVGALPIFAPLVARLHFLTRNLSLQQTQSYFNATAIAAQSLVLQVTSILLVCHLCVISILLVCHLCVISILLVCHLCVISISLVCHLCVISILLICHLCVISISLVCHLCVISILLICHLCVISILLVCHLCVISILLVCHLCVISISLVCYLCVTSMSLICHQYITCMSPVCHKHVISSMSPAMCHSPRYCDDSPHSTSELSERLCMSELPLEGATAGVDAHLGDRGERLFLAVLEATYEHKQVLLLVDKCLAETLRLEVTAVQSL